jgi:hypothetical protein
VSEFNVERAPAHVIDIVDISGSGVAFKHCVFSVLNDGMRFVVRVEKESPCVDGPALVERLGIEQVWEAS